MDNNNWQILDASKGPVIKDNVGPVTFEYGIRISQGTKKASCSVTWKPGKTFQAPRVKWGPREFDPIEVSNPTMLLMALDWTDDGSRLSSISRAKVPLNSMGMKHKLGNYPLPGSMRLSSTSSLPLRPGSCCQLVKVKLGVLKSKPVISGPISLAMTHSP